MKKKVSSKISLNESFRWTQITLKKCINKNQCSIDTDWQKRWLKIVILKLSPYLTWVFLPFILIFILLIKFHQINLKCFCLWFLPKICYKNIKLVIS